MTKDELSELERRFESLSPEERKGMFDSCYYQSKGLTGYASIDEPWMKNYQPRAREIASNIIKDRSISDVVLEKLEEHSEIDALKYFNSTISRPNFKMLVEKWAKAFREIGVERDEIVPIYGTFFPDVCAMILALNQIGATVYPLKLSQSKEDFNRETAESKVAIVFDGMWKNVEDIFSDDRFKYVIAVSAADGVYPPLKRVIQMKSYLDAVKNKSLMPSSKKYLHSKDMMEMADAYRGEYKEPFKENRIAFINPSSGSTINGQVKGIMSTNEAALAQLAKTEAAQIPYFKGDSVLTNLPPMASTAMFCLFIYPLYKGLTLIDEPRLSADKFYSQVIKYKPQVALASGSLWKRFFYDLKADAKKNGLPDLSFFKMPIVGGESITPGELDAINETLKLCGSPSTMFDGYGMSELFSVFSTEKEETKRLEDRNKPVICTGLPFPNIQAGIFDENGKELRYNERGELCMRDKDIVMRGYYNKPELTTETLKEDGWLHSGDIAEIDEEGLVYIYGRKSDKAILPSGKEVYLFDIANKIKEDKNIKDAIVFSIPLADNSSILLAHIVFEDYFYGDKNKELELIDQYLELVFDGELVIAGYKEHVDGFVVSPTSSKVDRNAMYHEKDDYKKIVNGEELVIGLIESEDGLTKVDTPTKIKKAKVFKKQM
ncbi:MAG: acyl--CoA ligase [Bacilli bacterium]|nr:acyl--CoA ligase [Bacilli bacterium]